jgi:hypothetical protein
VAAAGTTAPASPQQVHVAVVDAREAGGGGVAHVGDGTHTRAASPPRKGEAAQSAAVTAPVEGDGDDAVDGAAALPAGWSLLDWVEFVNLRETHKYRAWETE